MMLEAPSTKAGLRIPTQSVMALQCAGLFCCAHKAYGNPRETELQRTTTATTQYSNVKHFTLARFVMMQGENQQEQ